MLRYIIWLIVVFVAVKIAGEVIRYVRRLLTPNKHIRNPIQQQRAERIKNIEDVPYEEIKDKE